MGMMDSAELASSVDEGAAEPRFRKRSRLSRACNACRARKVRCDEKQPACSRCIASKVPCITTDPGSDAQVSSLSRKRAGTSLDPPSELPQRQRPPFQRGNSSTLNSQGRSRGSVHDLLNVEDTNVTFNGQSLTNLSPDSFRSAATPRMQNDHYHGANHSLSALTPHSESSQYAFNTASRLQYKYMGASSLQVFTQWLQITFRLESDGLTDRFQYGMRHAEEMDIPDELQMPQLPMDWRRYCRAFIEMLHPLFPLVDDGDFMNLTETLATCNLQTLSRHDRPKLALVYACLSIGAKHLPDCKADSSALLQASCSLYGYLAAYPYMESAQALLALTLALRCYSRDGAANQALGQAIRILHSIGAHRKASQAQEQVRRTWWSAYCLERLMSLETGRPSAIDEDEIDQLPLSEGSGTLLGPLMQLCRIQGDVQKRLFSASARRSEPITPREVFTAQSELDQALQSWYHSLNYRLRPENLFITDHKTRCARAFILLQYHTTMSTIHRSALLMDEQIHTTNLRIASLPPESEERLLSSRSICISSAQHSARIFLQLLESSPHIAIISPTHALMAAYILAIKSLRDAGDWMAKTDLSLLHSTAEAIEARYKDDGQDPGFYSMLRVLRGFASKRGAGGTHGLQQNEAPAAVSAAHDPVQDWSELFPRLFLGDLQMPTDGMVGDDGFGENMLELLNIPVLSDDEIMNWTGTEGGYGIMN